MTRKQIASRKAVLTKKIARLKRWMTIYEEAHASRRARTRGPGGRERTDPFWRNSYRIELIGIRSNRRHLRNYLRERAALETATPTE